MANRLRGILLNLIGREQCGFIADCSLLDNILVVQMIAHLIDNDSNKPSANMLIKIDVEKAYNALYWNTAITTLSKIGFPAIWISCITSCMSSARLYLVLSPPPNMLTKIDVERAYNALS